MSNKPIHAEVVRATELNPGDRFAYLDTIATVEKVEIIADSGSAKVFFIAGTHSMFVFYYPTTFVARFLPKPVEVREFWRADCAAMIKEGTEQECRDWIKEMDYKSTLDQVTEIVKYREEVRP